MIHDLISHEWSTVWAQVGLVIFVVVFAAIVIWTYRGHKDRFKRESELPLDDGAGDAHSSTTENHNASA